MLAIKHALGEWRHYLIGGKQFKVLTDHQSLQYLHVQPTLNRREARWLDFFAEFDMEIVYAPGPTNRVADALSRHPSNQLSLATLRTSTITVSPQMKIEIQQGLETDKDFFDIVKTLKTQTNKDTTNSTKQRFELIDELLYLKEGKRLCIPKTAN